MEEAEGILSAGPGTIDRTLIDAATKHLGLVPTAEEPPATERVPYEQLAMSLVLDANGLKLQGRCTHGGPGTVLANADGRLLGEPAPEPRPVVALVQTLVPQNAVQVPATRQTDWLLRHLPVPDVVPPDPDAVPSHARLRLRETQQK